MGKGGDRRYIHTKRFLARRRGILSAATAKNGLPGSEYIFEGSDGTSGICSAFGFDKHYLEESVPFRGDFSIADVVCKASPSCLFTQTTARVAKMAIEEGVKASDIKSGTIWTATKAKNYGYCNNPGPFVGLIQGA